MTPTLLASVIVTVTLIWGDPNSMEDGTKIYREIAGTFEQVGEVSPDITTFSEMFTATEGAQLPYHVRPFNSSEMAPPSNEWIGVVPLPPEPCQQKGKSKNCR